MEQVVTGLRATPSARLAYQTNVLVRSFLLERPAGNVLVYNSPGITAAASDIRNLGGATRLLINHAHEGMYGDPNLDAPAFVHKRDQRETAATMSITGVFTDRQMIDDDLEVIPTPGHTRGTTSYLWDSGEHRFLFTGDFIWIEHGEWKAVVLHPSLRRKYLESLELVRDLPFDTLVPWGTTDDTPAFAVVDEVDRRARIDAIITRVEAGGKR